MSSSPRYRAGTRIFGAKQGAFATRIVAEEAEIRNVPVGWGENDTSAAAAAAGLFVTAPTSYAALVLRAKLQPGEWVLIHAAAGGIGLAAVQIAKALGGFVIAAAGTAAKLEIARKYGADKTVNYSKPGWEGIVKKMTPQGKGVDVVIDPVGMVNKSLNCVRWNARIVVIGFTSGKVEEVKMNRVLLKNVFVVGLHWGLYTDNAKKKEEEEEAGEKKRVLVVVEEVEEVWKGIEGLIAKGQFREMAFERRWKGLREVGEGLLALGGRETWGKVLVDLVDREGEKEEEEKEEEERKGQGGRRRRGGSML